MKELAPNPSCWIFSQVMMIFFFLAFSFNAQGLSDDDSSAPNLYDKYHELMMTIIPAVASALFSIGILIIILRFCPDSALSGTHLPTVSIVTVSDIHSPPVVLQTIQLGLDSTVIEAFPLFQYSEVNDIEIGRDFAMLECAVCLSEFEVEETLRLLPKCNHVFHQQCIDTWLANHVTCPVCRGNLIPEAGADLPQQTIVVVDNNLSPSDETNEIISQPDQVAVDEERQILES